MWATIINIVLGKSWITTLGGVILSICIALEPILNSGQMPTKVQLLGAIVTAIVFRFAKSTTVTGTEAKQSDPDEFEQLRRN